MTANYHPVPTLAHEPPFSSSFSHLRFSRFPSPSSTPLSLSLSSSFPSNFLSRSLLPYLPYIRFTRTHAHVPGHGRLGRARARCAYTLTRALSRQYRKLKDWAMIARGPTWPFHPLPTTLPAIYRAPARLPPREGKEGREWAFVLLSENYRIGREK